MTFTDVIQKNSSERYTYIRFTPRKQIRDGILSDEGGGVYSTYFEYPIISVIGLSNNTQASSSSLSDGGWYYDTVNKIYYTKHDGSVDEVVSYQIHFTTKNTHYSYSDPTDTNTDQVKWLSRVKGVPRITDSLKNVYYGYLTTQSYPITIMNQDQGLSEYFDFTNYWQDIPVEIWLSVNDEYEKLFTGVTGHLSSKKGELNIAVRSHVHSLDKTFLFGEVEDNILTEGSGSNFTGTTITLRPEDSGAVIPIIYGQTEPVTQISKWYNIQYGTPTTLPQGSVNPYSTTPLANISSFTYSDKAFRPVCISVRSDPANKFQNGSYWLVGRSRHSTVLKQRYITSFSAISINYYASSAQYRNPNFDANGNFTNFDDLALYKTTVTDHNLVVGNTVKFTWDFGGGTFFTYAHVRYVDGNTIEFASTSHIYTGAAGSILGSLVSYEVLDDIPVSLNTSEGRISLTAEVDYRTVVTTVGDSKYFLIDFTPSGADSTLFFDYNLNLEKLEDLDITCYVELDSLVDQEDVIEDILIGAGLSTNTSQFNTVATTNSSVMGQYSTILPTSRSSKDNYKKVLEPLLRDTSCFVFPDRDGVFQYGFLGETPTDPLLITEKDILLNTLSVDRDLDDATTTFKLSNPYAVGSTTITSDSLSAELKQGRPTSKAETLTVADFADNQWFTWNSILFHGLTLVKFRVPHKFLDVFIGDHVKVKHRDLIGTPSTYLSDPLIDDIDELVGRVVKTAKSETSVSLTVAVLNYLYD